MSKRQQNWLERGYKKGKYLFGDIVVVDNENIGVVVKSWERILEKGKLTRGFYYEVYVRMYNSIKEYKEEEIERYLVRHKYLDEQELEWQNN